MKARGHFAQTGAAFALVLVAGSTEAASTGSAGGNGGQSYSTGCPPNAMLVGVRAKEGSYVDNLEPICGKFFTDGSLSSVISANMSDANEGAGLNETVQCSSGKAINGFKGSAGGWIDSLVFGCRDVGPGGTLTGGTTFLSKLGGTGGTPFSFKECPGNAPALEIFGKSDLYIDKIALDCGIPTLLTQPTSLQPIVGSLPIGVGVGGGSALPDLVPTFTGTVLRHENAFRRIGNNFCANLPPAPTVTQARTGQITVGNVTWGVVNSSNNAVPAATAMQLRAGNNVLQSDNVGALAGGQGDTVTYVRAQSATNVVFIDANTNAATKNLYGGQTANGCFQQVMQAFDPLNWQDPQFTVAVDINDVINEVSDGNNSLNF